MHRLTLAVLVSSAALCGQTQSPLSFSGRDAFALTRRAVAFGPRADGTTAIQKLRTLIRAQLANRGCEISSDAFTANTPDGPIPMENIIAKFPGKSGRIIAVTGHYDTKNLPGFVGANDGGSSTGFLLELAAVLQRQPRTDAIWLVFFDGEEARRDWSDTDSVYGSRHLAEKWETDGTLRKIKALIDVDMIGDKNLKLVWDTGSSSSLRELVWDAADSLGYTRYFPREGGPIEDDHLPFIEKGVPSLDLIDFESQSTFWHTARDTMDKLDAASFQIVGDVVVKALGELERQ
jgi:Zn-dependent M28 family amino/carboxypeptidase